MPCTLCEQKDNEAKAGRPLPFLPHPLSVAFFFLTLPLSRRHLNCELGNDKPIKSKHNCSAALQFPVYDPGSGLGSESPILKKKREREREILFTNGEKSPFQWDELLLCSSRSFTAPYFFAGN